MTYQRHMYAISPPPTLPDLDPSDPSGPRDQQNVGAP